METPEIQNFAASFPNIAQWIENGGKLYVASDANENIVASFGDSGGFPYQNPVVAKSANILFEQTDRMAQSLIETNKEMLKALLAGGIPETSNLKYIHLPGLRPVENPAYKS